MLLILFENVDIYVVKVVFLVVFMVKLKPWELWKVQDERAS